MAHTASRPGQAAGGADDALELFLKKYAGEVLTAFERFTVMMSRHLTRSITSGKTASFPVTARATASYVTPGNEVAGSTRVHGERLVHVDYPLVSDVYLAEWDELVNHYDVRSIYSNQNAEALANSFDITALLVLGMAARGTDVVGNELPDGTVVTDADGATNGGSLAASAFEVAQKFDEKYVPNDTRYLFVKPAQYYLLGQTTKVLNRDWGGSGAYAEGTVLKVGGLEIVKTNNVPTTNVASTPVGANNLYEGNFSTTIALAGHKSAIGTVKMKDIATSLDWIPEKLAHLLMARMIVGTGVLRPEAAAEIKAS
jgi:Phage capsid protein